MFKTILVAIDGSGYAREALRVANDLAKTYGSRLVLLHVVDNKPLPKELRHFAEMEDVTAPTLPTAVGERILDDWQRRAAESGVSDIKTLLREGDPAGQIIEAAKDHGGAATRVPEQDAGQSSSIEGAGSHRGHDGPQIEDLLVVAVLLEEIRPLERLNVVGHARMAEVEAMRDEARARELFGDAREHPVVLVALEAVGDKDHAGGRLARRMGVADDRLTV